MLNIQKTIMSFQETMDYLGVSKSCLYSKCANKEIPHYRSPHIRRTYFVKEEIDAWLLSNRIDVNQEVINLLKKGVRYGK